MVQLDLSEKTLQYVSWFCPSKMSRKLSMSRDPRTRGYIYPSTSRLFSSSTHTPVLIHQNTFANLSWCLLRPPKIQHKAEMRDRSSCLFFQKSRSHERCAGVPPETPNDYDDVQRRSRASKTAAPPAMVPAVAAPGVYLYLASSTMYQNIPMCSAPPREVLEETKPWKLSPCAVLPPRLALDDATRMSTALEA